MCRTAASRPSFLCLCLNRGFIQGCLHTTTELLHTCADLGPLHANLHNDQADQHRHQAANLFPPTPTVMPSLEQQLAANLHSRAAARHEFEGHQQQQEQQEWLAILAACAQHQVS